MCCIVHSRFSESSCFLVMSASHTEKESAAFECKQLELAKPCVQYGLIKAICAKKLSSIMVTTVSNWPMYQKFLTHLTDFF